jgi:hypothetical protein
MKFSKALFSILSMFVLLSMSAIFAAGSLIFLIVQLYNYIFLISGFWSAFAIGIATIFLLFAIFLELIERNFMSSFNSKKVEDKKSTTSITKKLLISVLAYELSKIVSRFLHHYYDKKRAEHA